MKQLLTTIIAFTLILSSCGKKSSEEQKLIIHSNHPATEQNIIADTIIYSVFIRNFDESDMWANERLKHVQANKLIETIFENVYNKKLKVYDYFTKELLSLEQVKALEESPGYSRDLIQELQFEELWLMDEELNWFHKEVLAITVGYAVFNTDGTQRGLKPVFKIHFNQKK